MANAIEVLLGNMFATVFGTQLMIGIFGLLSFIILAVALRLSFELTLVIMLPLIMVLSFYGFLPQYALIGAGIIAGGLIGLAILRLVRR